MQTVQERGGAGGAQPPLNCLTHSNAALRCKDQAAISEMVEQQWDAEGECSPHESLSLHLVQLQCRYNFNAGAGSAPFFVIRRITPYLLVRSLLSKKRLSQRSPTDLDIRYKATSDHRSLCSSLGGGVFRVIWVPPLLWQFWLVP